MHKTKSCGIWVLLWRIPEGFFILKTFRVCTRSVVGCQYQSVFDGILHPLQSCQNQTSFWDASKQHPSTTRFGWIFLFKNMFCWDSLIWTYLSLFWQNNGKKTMNYVHLSQNLHILCAFKSKLAHTLCTFKPKFAHTLCANKPCLLEISLIVCKVQAHSGRWLVGTRLRDGRPLTLSLETIDDVKTLLT